LAHQAGCWLTAVLHSLPSASAPRGLLTCFLPVCLFFCVRVLAADGAMVGSVRAHSHQIPRRCALNTALPADIASPMNSV
jgi:hypothetical protein